MAKALLMISLLLFLCILLGHFGKRLGVPSLLLFILLGMAASLTGMGGEFRSRLLVRDFCNIGLIFIMFYGGFGTNWARARKTALPAGLLSTLGVIMTALLVMLFCRFALSMDWMLSFLLGSVISSTDAASVFGILRSRHLNLKYGTASLLEVESGSNDPCANILLLVALTMLQGTASAGSVLALLLKQFGIGIFFGFLVAGAAVWVMEHVRTAGEGYGVIFMLAAAMASYSLSECLGGNGYLAVYITGIFMGNNAIPQRRALVDFFDGITGLIQVFIFFLLGLVSVPAELPASALNGLLIALFLTFVARPLADFVILKPFHAPRNQRLLIDWCGLRGASAIVFAIVAALDPATDGWPDNGIFNTVVFIVLFSILVQGSLIPLIARKLDMTDSRDDVMRTFNDWDEISPISFIKIPIAESHPWCGKRLSEVRPSEILGGGRIVSVIRNDRQLTAVGPTRLQAGDTLVAIGESVEGTKWGTLNEVTVDAGHPWANLHVRELQLEKGSSVVAIRRGETILIPDGEALICAGDCLELNENKEEAGGDQP